jgi:hypothetical protein
MARTTSLTGLLLFLLSGCGSDLTSIKISPAVADAKNFPNGQVQFTATAIFDESSKPVVLRDIVWCTGTTSGFCDGFINPGATVDGNGVAVCGVGINKSFTILAGRSSSIGMPDRGIQLDIFGSATLICP